MNPIEDLFLKVHGEAWAKLAEKENHRMLVRNGGYSARYGDKTYTNAGRKTSFKTHLFFEFVSDGLSVPEAVQRAGITLEAGRRAIRRHESMRGYATKPCTGKGA